MAAFPIVRKRVLQAMNRYFRPVFALLVALAVLASLPTIARMQSTVTAEAYIEANIRATTAVDADLVGTITSGTSYPVIGRSEFFPWLLLGDPATLQPFGWVFQDLVQVTGDLTTVPFSSVVIGTTPPTPTQAQPPAAATAVATTAPASEQALVGVAVAALDENPQPTVTATATAFVASTGVTGSVVGEVNVRFGPGIDFPRIGVARAGEIYEITAYHTQFPWVQIRYDNVSGGLGWIAIDLLEIDGNIYTLPSISTTRFDLPTLTPTPDAVMAASGLPGFNSAPLSPEFKALGDAIWSDVLAAGFEPETSRLGSLFLMDLQTGEAIAFGDNIAYSGMSLSKINILLTFYRFMDQLPSFDQARTLANMMICSENTSSNRTLSIIGGDPYSGAAQVTNVMRDLQLDKTFMVAPFLIDPRITPQPVAAPSSPADQTRANPDPFNQITVSEMGWMLYGIYQCAADGTGPLIDTFGDSFNQRECQQMLELMQGNRIGALLEASVPDGIAIAHKHGWIDDTHGDAGVVFTPGGDYVFVMVLYNPTWLNFEESFPLIEESARQVYNYFNPDAPLPATRESVVPEVCDLNNEEGYRLIERLALGEVGP